MEIELIKERLEADIEFLKAPEGFIRAGHPRYFTLFGRDALIIAWQLLDYDATIAKDTLLLLAQFQGKENNALHEEEPGKIIHEWWGDIATKLPEDKPEIAWPFPYYGAVDVTFLYLMVASMYFQKTQDTKAMQSIKPAMLAAITWMLEHAPLDDDPLVEYSRQNPKGLLYQSWRDSDRKNHPSPPKSPFAIVEVQGYKYAACTMLDGLLHLYKEPALAKRLHTEAKKLQQHFLDIFWWPEENYFYYMLDKHHEPVKIVTSNPGHLLCTGILPPEKSDAVVERLFKNDICTPFGIRTESTNSPHFDAREYQMGSIWPHDNWIIAEGMRIQGYQEEYEKIKQALLHAYRTLGHIPELYSVDTHNSIIEPKETNALQGWASAGLLQMISQ